MMEIAILALQGAFEEHAQMLSRMGVAWHLVRNVRDWTQPKGGLIIPGGESTTMLKLTHDLGLFEAMQSEIRAGLPTFGTCAGLIMLDAQHLDTMNIEVRRNAYGRQLGSFCTTALMNEVGETPMTFIRAPYIESVGPGVKVLSVVDGHIVAARQGRQLVTAFHPELSTSTAVHKHFLSLID